MPVPDLDFTKVNNFGSIPIDLEGAWLKSLPNVPRSSVEDVPVQTIDAMDLKACVNPSQTHCHEPAFSSSEVLRFTGVPFHQDRR